MGNECVVVLSEDDTFVTLFRGSEPAAQAYLAGFNEGRDRGNEEGRDKTFDEYGCFDAEGNGPMISRRRWNEMGRSNEAFMARAASSNEEDAT